MPLNPIARRTHIAQALIGSLMLLFSTSALAQSGVLASDPSVGCGKAQGVESGNSTRLLMHVGQVSRSLDIYVPPGYRPDVPSDLVVVFHGYGDSSDGIAAYSGFREHAEQENYLVVFPQALGVEDGDRIYPGWNDLSCSASPGPEGPKCSSDAHFYPSPTAHRAVSP
ncbi:MAG: hypothetical protein AAF420_08800 [Pseudomonadota bacterium]